MLLGLTLPGWIGCSELQHTREVEMETALGTILLEVYPGRAPLTAGNFIKLVEDGIYNGASFYRVVRPDNQPGNPVKIEVIQGGLYDDDVIGRYPAIAHETTEKTGLRHQNGVISMARNQPGSASTEFFICLGDQPELDFAGSRNPDGQGFAAFGKVVSGMDLVRAIQQMPDSGQYLTDPVRILRISLR